MTRSILLRSSICLAAALFSLVSTPASAQIVNGGFETGNFNGWTSVDSSFSSNVGSDPLFANSGTYHANLGAFQTTGTLSQTFNTTFGETYDLSFALASDSNVPPNQFSIYWDNTLVFSVTDAAVFAYTNFTVSGLAGTGGATTLEFRYRNDADYFRLDDVSVSIVPESSTAASVLLGLGLLSAVQIRSKSRRTLR